ncbi:hypothetical protein HK405_003405, partial [Cladochytrium tenue]
MLSAARLVAAAAGAGAAALAAFSTGVDAACTGVTPGYFCLVYCGTTGAGFESKATVINSLELGPFQVIFDPSDPWNPKINSVTYVDVTIPASLSSVNLNFTGAGTNLVIYGPNGSKANLTVPDFDPASGTSSTKQVVLPLTPANGDHLSVASGDQASFSDFFKQSTLADGEFNVTLIGYADTKALVYTAASSTTLCFDYVPMNFTASLT